MLRPPRINPPQDAALLDWLNSVTVESVRDAILARRRYPDEGQPTASDIELVQTHISTVFLTPQYVFKFKRPVDVGFADFSTLARRERFCRAELDLNRRLARDVYLDVLPLSTTADGFALDESGVIVDWCVVMRRLPARDMLDRRLRDGRVNETILQDLAALLVRFHEHDQDGDPALEHYGSEAVIRENWNENFTQTEPFVGEVLSEPTFTAIRTAVEGWMVRHGALLAERRQGGFIRDGHGDLRCEHIYIGPTDPPTGRPAIDVIDCIEFNERFRYGDVASDLAFLLMDLTAQGHPEYSRVLLDCYTELSGDRQLTRLIPFYACYRAYVRGKVTAFKLRDRNLSPVQLRNAEARAQAFFRLALEFSRQMAPPVLVLVAGLMGTGKTSLAEGLANAGRITTFNSDAVRKELAGTASPEATRAAEFGEGIYTPDWNERTYDALFDRAEAALGSGISVILDASFSDRAQRLRAQELAERLGARLVVLECRLDPVLTRQRLRDRERAGSSISDGRVALYERQRERFEPITELPAAAHWVVDTHAPTNQMVADLLPRMELPPPLFGL